MPDVAPSPALVRAALDELLAWQGIARSPQLSQLLRYVVEKTLSGDGGSIKAYSIAVDVFGRPATFDPQADPIVRVQARRLRTLLEQFYETGQARAAVQIHLPLGRYVPEFQMPGTQGLADSAGVRALPAVAAAPVGRRSSLVRFLRSALLALCFTLIGVALAVAIIRWTLPSTPPAAAPPDVPRVTVGTFDNLTGDAKLDGLVEQFSSDVARGLAQFETVEVASGGSIVHGAVQRTDGRYSIGAVLSGGASGIAWSATIAPPAGTDDATTLADAANALVIQLASGRGPLQGPGRSWLDRQAQPLGSPTLYVCELEYLDWRDRRTAAKAANTIDCLGDVLSGDPSSAIALAADAALRSWQATYAAPPGGPAAPRLVDEAAEAAKAVALKPDSSFVVEQQAIVLARQGSRDAALGALKKALSLNPANMDAEAASGLLLWLSGQFDAGATAAEAAITSVPSPPPFYYMTRALNALRERRYFDAIDAAQALAAGEDEIGPAIALAAAPQAARNDLIDRYRPQILGDPHFEAVGILPRLAQTIGTGPVLERIREGLTLAGIAPADLDGPFSADGTPKN